MSKEGKTERRKAPDVPKFKPATTRGELKLVCKLSLPRTSVGSITNTIAELLEAVGTEAKAGTLKSPVIGKGVISLYSAE